MKHKVAIALMLAISASGCLNAPTIHYSSLLVERDSIANSRDDRLAALLRNAVGAQFGDEIFKTGTTVRLMTPEIDFLRFKKVAEQNQIGEAEIDARFNRLQDLHRQYVIFNLELVLPFYAGWTQAELRTYLRNNLSLTLENGRAFYYPDRTTFQLSKAPKTLAGQGKVQGNSEHVVPVQIYFRREQSGVEIFPPDLSKLVLKLRLKQSPPFRIGFFDEKFYQGFVWKIDSK